jgi:hypothetical protein
VSGARAAKVARLRPAFDCKGCGGLALGRIDGRPMCGVCCGGKDFDLGDDDAPAPAPIVETDALWYGRELNRHASRAGAAFAQVEQLRAALGALAVQLRERARETRERARDSFPFGADPSECMTEKDAAYLEGVAGGMERAAVELDVLREGV